MGEKPEEKIFQKGKPKYIKQAFENYNLDKLIAQKVNPIYFEKEKKKEEFDLKELVKKLRFR